MEIILHYKNMSKQGKLNVQAFITILLLVINMLILAGIVLMQSNDLQKQKEQLQVQQEKIERLEHYQDTTNASLLKIVAHLNKVGG